MAVAGGGGAQMGGRESFSKNEVSSGDWYALGVIFPIDDESCEYRNTLERAMKMKTKTSLIED